jgi:hypothetical protein
MNNTQRLLQRQAAWQKNRAILSWPEKIRMAEAMQGTIHRLRALKNNRQKSGKEQRG